MEEIKIVIDQDTLDRYDKFYFRCHPKAKKLLTNGLYCRDHK